jgi:PAS domain-containing protein
MPARLLLDRLPVPIWAVHGDTVVYTNDAFAEMIGHDRGHLSAVFASELIRDVPSLDTPLTTLLQRRAGELMALRHADGSILQVVVSRPMLLRADDPVTLVGVQDVTEHIWDKSR